MAVPLVWKSKRFHSVWYAVAYRILKARGDDTGRAFETEAALGVLGFNFKMVTALFDAAGVAVAAPDWEPGNRIPAPRVVWQEPPP